MRAPCQSLARRFAILEVGMEKVPVGVSLTLSFDEKEKWVIRAALQLFIDSMARQSRAKMSIPGLSSIFEAQGKVASGVMAKVA